MGRFLTGKARLQQTERVRYWKLLDNEVYKDNDGKLYLAPRNMWTDNYTIPLFVSWIAGSPVDFDTRCAHEHDGLCYSHKALLIYLTEKELIDKGYLKFSDKHGMWVCEDIPPKYLYVEKVSKFAANNLLYSCMEAANVPFINRIIIRIGVCFNLNWFIDKWLGKIFDLDLEKVYDEDFWEEHVRNWS